MADLFGYQAILLTELAKIDGIRDVSIDDEATPSAIAKAACPSITVIFAGMRFEQRSATAYAVQQEWDIILTTRNYNQQNKAQAYADVGKYVSDIISTVASIKASSGLSDFDIQSMSRPVFSDHFVNTVLRLTNQFYIKGII